MNIKEHRQQLEEEIRVDGWLNEGNELPFMWEPAVTSHLSAKIKEDVEFRERQMRDLEKYVPKIHQEDAPIYSNFMVKIYRFRREINVELKRLFVERSKLLRNE